MFPEIEALAGKLESDLATDRKAFWHEGGVVQNPYGSGEGAITLRTALSALDGYRRRLEALKRG